MATAERRSTAPGSSTVGLDADERILLSEPIHLEAEVRMFLLDGAVLDAATYEGSADSRGAIAPAEDLAAQVDLPRAVVLDFGLTVDKEWVFIEANAAWGSGLNGCKAARILPAIIAAIEVTT